MAATITAVREVPADTPLEKRLDVSARDSVLKMGQPVVLGQLDGQDIVLLVKPDPQ